MCGVETEVIKVIEREMVKQGVKLEDKFLSLGADELDMLVIVVELEDMYSIRIDDDTIEKMKRVRDLVEYIKNKKDVA